MLTPRLVGERIRLHPVAVIFAIMAGGQLFGFFGILLALPVATAWEPMSSSTSFVDGGRALCQLDGGHAITCDAVDGVVASYRPSIWEITLGVGGIALALLIVQVAVRVLRFLPDTLEDSAIDPHAAKAD